MSTRLDVSDLTFDEDTFSPEVPRIYGLDEGLVYRLLTFLEKEREWAGEEPGVTYTARWNEDGEPIGPDIAVDAETARLVLTVAEGVRAAVDKALADR